MKPALSLRYIAWTSLALLLVKVAGAGLDYGVTVIIARRLGAEESGLFFLSVTIVSAIALVSRLGIDTWILKHAALTNSNCSPWKLLRPAISVVGITALVGSAVSLLVAGVVTRRTLSAPQWFWFFAIATAPLALTFLTAEFLRGLQRPLLAQLLTSFVSPLTVIVVLTLWGTDLNVLGAAAAYLFGTLAPISICIGIWVTLRRRSESSLTEPIRGFQLITKAFPFFLVTLIQSSNAWVGVLALGLMDDPRAVAIYSTGFRTAAILALLLNVVSVIVAPRFAALYSSGRKKELSRLASQCATITAIVATVPFAFIFAMPETILVWFGEDFAGGGVVLQVLLLGQWINALTGPVGYLLLMCGYERAVNHVSSLSAVLHVCLALVLVPISMHVGAAISTAGSLALQNLMLVAIAHRKLGIWMVPRLSSTVRTVSK